MDGIRTRSKNWCCETWEYRVLEMPLVEGYTPAGEVQQFLNQAGTEGWELARVSERRYYFKRAK